jgi:hypothetical protein
VATLFGALVLVGHAPVTIGILPAAASAHAMSHVAGIETIPMSP